MQGVARQISIHVDGLDIIVEQLEDGTFHKPDYLQGAEREVIGKRTFADGTQARATAGYSGIPGSSNGPIGQAYITAPATPEAQQYAGTGTALKPAAECWWLCRKPLAERSVAANVLKYGVGGLNIDKSRVATDEIISNGPARSGLFFLDGFSTIDELREAASKGEKTPKGRDARKTLARYENSQNTNTGSTSGRFPSHLLLSHTLLCTPEQCAAGCPVAELDEQSGISKSVKAGFHGRKDGIHVYGGNSLLSSKTILRGGMEYGDQGGASRYFATFRPDVPFVYSAKASRRERNEGCEALPVNDAEPHNLIASKWIIDPRHKDGGYAMNPSPALQNNHPTVKAQQLMRYLVRLITPPGGVVLDCFGGSGSTALACISEGMRYIIIEKELEYIEIIRARVAHAEAKAKMIA